MKYLTIVLCLFIASNATAQEWGTIKGNTATFKEIAPIWPGCEGENDAKRQQCFNQKLATHVSRNFKYPADEYKKNIQGEVVVVFDINTEGKVEIKKVEGGNKGLQAEARRIISAIPRMASPGMLAGKPHAIEYIVPLTFKTGK
jgi:TonB family protein